MKMVESAWAIEIVGRLIQVVCLRIKSAPLSRHNRSRPSSKWDKSAH